MPRHPFNDHEGAEIRPALLRELTDLYVQKPAHSPDEERLFTELALRLIDRVDAAERARVGARLAAYPAAPFAVLRRLAEPEPALATPDPLLAAGDVQAELQIEANDLPRIEEPARDENLSETFFTAAPEERRLILIHLDISPIPVASVLSDDQTVVRLEQAALARQPDEFADILERAFTISYTCARRIAGDPSGEALITAAKALAVPTHALQRILLFLNPAIGHSVEAYFELVRLYDQISEHAARRMVTVWRMSDVAPSRKAAYQAQHWNDETTRARDHAMHGARRSGASSTIADNRSPSRRGKV